MSYMYPLTGYSIDLQLTHQYDPLIFLDLLTIWSNSHGAIKPYSPLSSCSRTFPFPAFLSTLTNVHKPSERTLTLMSTSKPSILLVGLPMGLDADHPPIKVPWADEPVHIHKELKEVVRMMEEKGYSSFELFG